MLNNFHGRYAVAILEDFIVQALQKMQSIAISYKRIIAKLNGKSMKMMLSIPDLVELFHALESFSDIS